MEAPLSSPSLHGPSQTQPSYFTPSSTSSSSSSSSSTQPSSYSSSQPATQQYAPQTQHPAYHPQSQTQYQVPPAPAQQRQPVDGTSPFLRDFNLVAEAAKRAQMAVLMRDMEAVGI